MKRFSSGGCYADITPKERAIANGQRSFVSFLLLQLSNSFLKILAVPNKAVFCIIIVIIVIIIIIIIIIIMQFIELQHARKRKFQKAPSVTYETTNCYTLLKDVKNLFASLENYLFTVPMSWMGLPAKSQMSLL